MNFLREDVIEIFHLNKPKLLIRDELRLFDLIYSKFVEKQISWG